MRVFNIICVVAVLIMSAVMVFPLLIIVGEFFTGNREHSLIHKMLTHEHKDN